MERKSERMDTAYSPRLHEEELSATAERILLRMVELWLENRGCGMVVSESFLDSTRRMVVIGSRLARGCVAVEGRLKIGLASRRLSGLESGCVVVGKMVVVE